MYSFYKKYFLLNLEDYPNIGFDFPITIVLFCFLIALIITTILVNYRRSKIEALIKQLTRHGANSESDAKTLKELNLDKKVFRYLLSGDGGQMAKMVAHVGEEKLTYDEYMEKIKSKDYKEKKIDFNEARFYIREEGKDRAKRVLAMGTTSLLNTFLFCLLLVAIYICLSLLMPGILSVINSFLGS